ncbi:cell surface protein [Lactobacillus sp. CBA3606]|uniref:cell surface protein n=1 Tax=Lactobacillus sp. CBA3606 TaxID=2099789 RepID=UPI000CFDAA17|nr:cell surface protein [Lactobacillus sp. CBA3606]AVK63829.1 cell surface protein [Lactobacillus sp. CBA3606]
MKKWVWMIVIVVVALGVGGYTYSRHQLQERSYASEMKTGKQAIKDQQYTKATTYFTKASRTKGSDTVAERYLSQTQTYVSAKKALQARQFTTAKADFTTVKQTKHGSSTLVTRATAKLSLIKTVMQHRTAYQAKYRQAAKLNQTNDFTDSNGILTVLFQSKRFSQHYYQDIYKKAKALRKENNAALKALTGSTPVINDSTQSATTSANSTSESSQPASDSASASGSNQMSSTPGAQASTAGTAESSTAATSSSQMTTSTSSATSGSNYSDAQIQATRAELSEAGLSGSDFSDAQIQMILQKAATEHTSPVQAAKHLQQ